MHRAPVTFDFERTDFTPSIEKKILVNCHLQTRLVCLGSINQSNKPRIVSFLKTIQFDYLWYNDHHSPAPRQRGRLPFCNLLFHNAMTGIHQSDTDFFIFSFPLRNVGRTVSPQPKLRQLCCILTSSPLTSLIHETHLSRIETISSLTYETIYQIERSIKP